MTDAAQASPTVVPKAERRWAMGAAVLLALAWTLGTLAALVPTSDPQRATQVLYPVAGIHLVLAGAFWLLAHAWVFAARPDPGPAGGIGVVGVVCAGLAADRLLDAGDLFAAALAALSMGMLVRRPPAMTPAGVILGAGLAICPLLVGAVAGGLSASRRMDACRPSAGRAARLGVGVLLGFALVGLAGWLDGRPPWVAVTVPEPLCRLGPAAVWRFRAGVGDLAAPLLGLGLLGLWLGGPVGRTGTPGGATDDDASRIVAASANPFPLEHAVRVWVLVNVLAMLCFPTVCAAHVMAWLAPLALTVEPGWRALREALSAPLPFSMRLTIVAFATLLALLGWPALRSAGGAVLVALTAG